MYPNLTFYLFIAVQMSEEEDYKTREIEDLAARDGFDEQSASETTDESDDDSHSGGGAMMSMFASYYGIAPDVAEGDMENFDDSPLDKIDSPQFDATIYVKVGIQLYAFLLQSARLMLNALRAEDPGNPANGRANIRGC